MRGKVAKKLRKQAYNIYIASGQTSRLMVNQQTGQVFWTGIRRIYQDLKRRHNEIRHI